MEGAWRGRRPTRRPLALLLLAAFLVRLPLIPLLGHGDDLYLIKGWALVIDHYGLDDVFALAKVDYIGYAYVLWLIDRIHGLFPLPLDSNSPLFHFLVKLPGPLADLGVTAVLYWLVRRLLTERPDLLARSLAGGLQRLPLLGSARLSLPEKGAIAAAALYAFNPAVIYDSAYWGQIDS
ncbi:MAG TPA: hypothetical protein VI877_02520, partial [Dehalococcoidia bacterium]|nr:hypothetical protein [Dehalococcoidia bacterium]